MTDTTMITSRSSVEQCREALRASVTEVMSDLAYEGMELSEDEVYCDLAASLLMDASRSVAEEVCRIEIGFVPHGLLDFWKRQDRSRQQLQERRAEEEKVRRAVVVQQRREQRLEAQAVQQDEDVAKLRAQRCPRCFTIPAANGACMC